MRKSEFSRDKISNNSFQYKYTEKDLDCEESPIRFQGEIATINYGRKRRDDFFYPEIPSYLRQFPSASQTKIRSIRKKLDIYIRISSQAAYLLNRLNHPDMITHQSPSVNSLAENPKFNSVAKKAKLIDMRQQFEDLSNQFEANSEEIERLYGENYVLFKDNQVIGSNDSEQFLYELAEEKNIVHPFLIQKASSNREIYEVITPFED
jgi:hypothetical protein